MHLQGQAFFGDNSAGAPVRINHWSQAKPYRSQNPKVISPSAGSINGTGTRLVRVTRPSGRLFPATCGPSGAKCPIPETRYPAHFEVVLRA